MLIANSVLFHCLPPGDRGRPELSIRDKIVRMISILHSDTYPDMDRWPGHPCIPRRVFGPREYLVDPPVQPTRPRVTSKPLPAAGGGSRPAQDQPQSEFGTFKLSEATGNACTSRSRDTESALINLFMSLFETISANLDETVKRRTLFACQEAASSMIAEELCDREELAEATHERPEATHGCPEARRVEYSAETADIRIVHPSRVPTSRKPVGWRINRAS